jgi:hypothetical protein
LIQGGHSGVPVIGVLTQPVADAQLSVVHALSSSQLMVVCAQPLAGAQLSVVHMLLSLQSTGVRTQPVIEPQLSVVHILPSLQSIGGWVPQPVAGEHGSLVHMSPSLQSTAAPGMQVPLPLHVSAMVHMLPSSHRVPADTGSPLEQPVAGSQPPWKHTGGGGQLRGAPG